MTPEERQLLMTLSDRVRNTPPQQRDMEADQLLRQLAQERPDTAYILAQTVLMQDFALRNAQAQIEDLQRQLSQQQSAGQGQGSFLGGLLGGGSVPPRQSSGSVPRVNPWSNPSQGTAGDYPPPPPSPPGAGYPGYQQGPVMQPSQTSGFLRNAAATAAGVAGGALLFQGINSLFSGHHGSLLGGDFSSLTPRDSLSERTVVNNYYEDEQNPAGHEETQAAYDSGQDNDDNGLMDADYDSGDDGDYGGGDFA